MIKRYKQPQPMPSDDELKAALEASTERMVITDIARKLLGFPAKREITIGTMRMKSELPRYRVLGICIRAAMYGFQNPTVKHMVERNQRLDEYAALERLAKAQGLA